MDNPVDRLLSHLKAAEALCGTPSVLNEWQGAVMRDIRQHALSDESTWGLDYSRTFFQWGVAALCAAFLLQATYRVTNMEEAFTLQVIQELNSVELEDIYNG